MHLRASLTKFWAYSSMLLVTGIILFLFGYVFYRGAGTNSWEFCPSRPGERYGGRKAESGQPLWGACALRRQPLSWEESLLLPQHSLWCFTAKDAGWRD